ncbi:MAG: RHS repeat-associated core domain-containing protein [Candidatus Obscuribacter sp.]|nr:RHS repeat-associated core domain-containing protein [Candidatus Obscuribacter sp.]MBK9280941.1 RHS repeat-associated core domain-containing protein [Candidatus Obscuribacter sp.]
MHNFVGSNVNFSYAFDSVGQMLSQRTSDPANFRWTLGAPGTVSYGTANNINQYPTVGGTGFSYSTDGNLTNDGVFKYEFNTERMMTRVRDAGTNAIVADYLYDPALRQRQKNVGGTKTNFYYAGWQRLADYDGTTNTLQQRFVYGTGLDEVLIQINSGGTKTYFHGNHQGSVIATTDASGAVLNRFKYSPYGESPSMSGTSHGYTGQRYDSETGLYYYKMRQYSPKLGRFLQADPIGHEGGFNLYSYVENSPMTSNDSLGLQGDSVTLFGVTSAGNKLAAPAVSVNAAGSLPEIGSSPIDSDILAFHGPSYRPDNEGVTKTRLFMTGDRPIYEYDYSSATRRLLSVYREETSTVRSGREYMLRNRKVAKEEFKNTWQYAGGFPPIATFATFSSADAWVGNFMTSNRVMIHGEYDVWTKQIADFNNAFGNIFRHAAVAATLVRYGFSQKHVAIGGLLLEGVETLNEGDGFRGDATTDLTSNNLGIQYGNLHKAESDPALFYGGLAEMIWRNLRSI